MKIRIAKGNKDRGIVIGNVFDKYGSSNPIVRKLMSGFGRSLAKLIDYVNPTDIHEVGCGEGYWIIQWHLKGIRARGSDFSPHVIAIARENAAKQNLPPDLFSIKSVYNLEKWDDRADLVVCCEVLEHLDRPEDALKNLREVANRYLIISVPREPVWRILNMLRAKYLTRFGNTPGHVQHWNKDNIVRLAGKYFDVVKVVTPFPWTMILCKQKMER